MTFFVICFGIGIVFLVITAVFGGLLDVFDIHLDGGWGEMPGGGHLSPLSPTFLSFFLTVFGGVGGVCMELWEMQFRSSLLIALVLSLAMATIVYLLLAKIFEKTQGGVEVNVSDLEGREAEVITSIPKDGMGEVALITAGGRTNGPARSEDGSPIPVNTTVVIAKIVGNSYIVRKKSAAAPQAAASDAAPSPSSSSPEPPASPSNPPDSPA